MVCRKILQSKKFLNPDIALIAIEVGFDRVIGSLKNDHALIKRVPNPNTGLHFLDIVKVLGPVDNILYREDKIPLYSYIEIITPSDYLTFKFQAIVPTLRDYIELKSIFKKHDSDVRYPFNNKDFDFNWRIGYCASKKIEFATDLLNQFSRSGANREVKEIEFT